MTYIKRAAYAAGVVVIVTYFAGVWLIVSAVATITGHGNQRPPNA